MASAFEGHPGVHPLVGYRRAREQATHRPVLRENPQGALGAGRGKRVAVLGLAFKANTDDIGFAPALEVMRRLLEEGAEVHASDPETIPRTRSLFPQVTYFEDPYEALKGVDTVLACTEWQIFRTLDCERAGKANGASGDDRPQEFVLSYQNATTRL